LPEHGPGAIARTGRRQRSTVPAPGAAAPFAEVEVRDLAVYEALAGDTEMATPLGIVAWSATRHAAFLGEGLLSALPAVETAAVAP
ncbi:MAG: hypothetical protein ACREKK_13110, partial [Candidatus Methylomirabilales bacterium]